MVAYRRARRRFDSSFRRHSRNEAAAGSVEPIADASVGGIRIEHVQLEPGSLGGWWSTIALRSIHVQVGGADVSLVRRFDVPADSWMFAVPTQMPSPARWNGFAVCGQEIIVVPPGSRAYAFDPPACRYVMLVLRPSDVQALEWEAPEPVTAAGAAVMQPSHGEFCELRRAIGGVIDAWRPWPCDGWRKIAPCLELALIDRLGRCLRTS